MSIFGFFWRKLSGLAKKALARSKRLRLAGSHKSNLPPPPDSTWSLSDGILSSSHILSPRFSLKLRTIEGNSIGKAPSATNFRKRVQNPQKMYPNPDTMLWHVNYKLSKPQQLYFMSQLGNINNVTSDVTYLNCPFIQSWYMLTVLLHCPITSMTRIGAQIRLVTTNHVREFCYSFD